MNFTSIKKKRWIEQGGGGGDDLGRRVVAKTHLEQDHTPRSAGPTGNRVPGTHADPNEQGEVV